MRLINCVRCRKPFVTEGGKLCPACLDEEDRAFDVIRAYLDEHPNAGLYQISIDTGVDEGIIVNLIRRGKLKSVERHLRHKCARCGAEVLIVDGDFCERCRRELSSKVRRAVSELSWKPEPETNVDGQQTRRNGQDADGSNIAKMFIREIKRKNEGQN